MINSRGPRTDPCGTPDVPSSQELYVEFILTQALQLEVHEIYNQKP